MHAAVEQPDAPAERGCAGRTCFTITRLRRSRVDGPSFSCPLTAGVVALLLQAYPTYTVEQVLALMRSSARQAAAPDNLLGWGIVNAAAAVQARTP